MYRNLKEIYLEVETIGANREWALELCSAIASFKKALNCPLSFGANLKVPPGVELEDYFKAFQRAGFSFVNIGLESGSERLRREVLHRYDRNKDIIKAVSLAKQYGLKVCFFNLVGIPGETKADFDETIKMNRICLPNWHFVSIFYPYPGTTLYRVCEKRGLMPKELDIETIEMERRRPYLDLPEFPAREVTKSYVWFDYHAFIGLRPIHKILGRVFTSWLRTTESGYHYYRALTKGVLLRRLIDHLRTY